MKTLKSIIGISLVTILFSSCASLKQNQSASTDIILATSAINQLKDSGIVVFFPTEHKKEKALMKLKNSNAAYSEDIEALKSRRNERLNLWQNAKNQYSFNNLSIVPDSLLKSYIIDPNNSKEIGQDNTLIESKLNDIYVLYTEYGGFEIKRNGQFLPNPFPNKVQAAWGSSIRDFLGVQSEEKSVNRFFTELEKQLNSFYQYTQRKGN